jgi:rhamnogalacturonan endolyase
MTTRFTPLFIVKFTVGSIIAAIFFSGHSFAADPRMEILNRGVVAVAASDEQEQRSVFVSWRFLDTDPDVVTFNVYRSDGRNDTRKLNDQPIGGGTWFLDAESEEGRTGT